MDDDKVTLKVAELILVGLGHKVVTADGGVMALEVLKTDKFDLIFLDIMMPDIYGIDVLRRIKANRAWKKIPVILQTGVRNTRDIEIGRRLGCTTIPKPYDKATLKKHMDMVFEVA